MTTTNPQRSSPRHKPQHRRPTSPQIRSHNHKNPSLHNHKNSPEHNHETIKPYQFDLTIKPSQQRSERRERERESMTVREEQRWVGLGTAGSRGWELDDGWFRRGVIWERKRGTDWEWIWRVNESWVIWERDRGTEWERERNNFLIGGMNKIIFFFCFHEQYASKNRCAL